MKEQSYSYSGTDQQKVFCRDMLYAWKAGWPEYIQNPSDDYPWLWEIANKCAKISQVSLNEEEGYTRIKNGIARIAAFCKGSINWSTKNIHDINLYLQKVLLEMQAFAKVKEKERDKIETAQRLFTQDQEKREREYMLSEIQRKDSLVWCINNWDYIWEHSQKVFRDSGKLIALNYEDSKKQLEELSEEYISALKNHVETMIENWKIQAVKEGIKY